MNEIGFERFRIELIEDYPCNDKYQLRQREGHFIREMGTLNKRIECKTPQEYYIENIDRKKKYDKQYYIDNAEKKTEFSKQYNMENAEKIKEYSTFYRIENADKIKEHNNKKVFCECGCEVNHSNLKRHQQSTKHLNLLQQKLTL